MSSARRQLAKPLGNLRQQRVAGSWPRLSLTTLKLSRSRNSTPTERKSRSRVGQRALQAVGEQRPVGEPGQRIVKRQVLELHLANCLRSVMSLGVCGVLP